MKLLNVFSVVHDNSASNPVQTGKKPSHTQKIFISYKVVDREQEIKNSYAKLKPIVLPI
jgi:hypothetical protein